jgi:hypothetical protein
LVFEEQVGRIRHTLAHHAAEQVDHRPLDGLAHQVEAGDFDRAPQVVDARRLPRPHVLQRARAAVAEAIDQRALQAIELEGVVADDDVARLLQLRQRCRRAGDFAEAADAVVAHQFDDRAQRPRRMQAGGVEQRRVADGDRRDVHLDDLHRPNTLGSHNEIAGT